MSWLARHSVQACTCNFNLIGVLHRKNFIMAQVSNNLIQEAICWAFFIGWQCIMVAEGGILWTVPYSTGCNTQSAFLSADTMHIVVVFFPSSLVVREFPRLIWEVVTHRDPSPPQDHPAVSQGHNYTGIRHLHYLANMFLLCKVN